MACAQTQRSVLPLLNKHRFIPFVREYLEAMEDEYYLALKEAIFNYKRRDPAKEKQLAVLRLR